MKPYFTIAQKVECEIPPVKGSRFIAIAVPVTHEKEAKELILAAKYRFPDARHWCWAYQLQQANAARFSDDGEPNGSAGKPILAPINGRQLYNVAVVVVRYFGGVKLGIGGLVRAYSQASNAALEAATIIEVIPKLTLCLTYRYDDTKQLAAALSALGLKENNTRYSDHVESTVEVVPEQVDRVRHIIGEYTSGKVKIDSFDKLV